MANFAEHAALRAEIEAFLYEEAELLDSWQLMEWAALFWIAHALSDGGFGRLNGQ